ncbi:MAG TPA: putative Ig domain-containing protein [Terriglobales bacterium]|nr:putative Ig domain-containing protein [Terriglobales bacterium]
MRKQLFLLLCLVLVSCGDAVSARNRGNISVTSVPTATAVQGSSYTSAFVASEGASPYKWSLQSGSLPPGLSLSNTGVVSGTPSAVGTYSFSAGVQDSDAPPARTAASATITVSTKSTTTPAPTVQLSGTSTITQGQSATLSWTSTNATSASINQGIGTVSPNGAVSVTPSATTTYTITVTGSGGTATSSATVTVNPAPNAPTVKITASPTSITPGQSATLSWTSTNATSASIDQGVGTVATSGTKTVSPTATATYTITVTGSAGTATAKVIVSVGAVSTAPTVQITASPTSITQGQSSTLSWSSTNATSATINQNIGTVATSGTKTVTPTATTTYTITVTGAGGSTTASTTVMVATAPPPSGSTAFDIKCSDPNVVNCINFDSPFTSTREFGIDAASTTKAVIDTSVYSSGSGSLRFDIPSDANANTSGSFHADFTSDLSTQFGETGSGGREFYLQWRQRFDPAMLTMKARNGGGFKLAIFGEGDTATKTAYSCTDNELVVQNYYQHGLPILYHSCGVKDNSYQGLYPLTSGSYLLQSGIGCASSTGTNCSRFVGNEWMTFQLHMKFGKDYRNDRNYRHDSTVELWVAREGQPSQLVVTMTDYDLIQHAATAINTGKLWLLPYETGRCPASFTITSAVRTGGKTTYTTSSHASQNGECILAGDQLNVAGVTDNSFNGTMSVVSVPNDTTVVVSQSGVADASSSGGKLTDQALLMPATAVWYDDLIISKRRLPDVGVEVPNAPDSLTVTNDGSTNLLTWRDNSDVKGSFAANSYVIERCQGQMYACLRTQSFTQVATTGVQSTWRDTAGSASTVYTYRVKAANGSGASAYSNAATNVSGPISDVTATPVSATSVQLTWSQQGPTATSFVIERATGTYQSPSSFVQVGTSTTRSFTDTTASPSVTYVYRVKGGNAAGSYESWGETYYGNTQYGGMSAGSQVTTPASATSGSGGTSTGARYPYGWSYITGARLIQSPSICPSDPTIQLVEGCSAVIRDWTSAVFRSNTEQLIMTGGGHGGYSGNEQYAVNLKNKPATFTRINEPSIPGVDGCQGGFDLTTGEPTAGQLSSNVPSSFPVQYVDVNGAKYCKSCQSDANGYGCAPSSKHNYGQLVYIPANSTGCSGEMSGDMLFVFNGFDAWAVGASTFNAWVYHYDTGRWQRLDTWAKFTNGVYPGKNAWGNSMDFDPVKKKMVMFTQAGGNGMIGEWDFCSNTYTEKARSPYWLINDANYGVIDPVKRVMLLSEGQDLYHIDIDRYTMTKVTSTAAANGCSPAMVAFGGMAYDPDRSKFVLWPNGGQTVYDYDVNTMSCSASSYGGIVPPLPTPYNGTFGRFRYVPGRKMYVLVTGEAIDTMVLCREPNGCDFN